METFFYGFLSTFVPFVLVLWYVRWRRKPVITSDDTSQQWPSFVDAGIAKKYSITHAEWMALSNPERAALRDRFFREQKL